MKIPLQSRKKGSINERRLHLFAKDEKGYPFYQLALIVETRRKRVPFFINFAVTQNDWQGC